MELKPLKSKLQPSAIFTKLSGLVIEILTNSDLDKRHIYNLSLQAFISYENKYFRVQIAEILVNIPHSNSLVQYR